MRERGQAGQRDPAADHQLPAVHREPGEEAGRAGGGATGAGCFLSSSAAPRQPCFPAAQDQSLAHYGRPKIDGELKITTVERRSKMDRYARPLDAQVGGANTDPGRAWAGAGPSS